MTKSQILNYIYNPAGAKNNAWMVKRFKKETFLKALEIYHTESHTAARQYLNYVKVKKHPAPNYRKAVNKLMMKADLLDLAKETYNVYRDYDPYSLDDEVTLEAIAEAIESKNESMLDELKEMRGYCYDGDDDEMGDRIGDLLKKIEKHYK